jgi:hypothetical protein
VATVYRCDRCGCERGMPINKVVIAEPGEDEIKFDICDSCKATFKDTFMKIRK